MVHGIDPPLGVVRVQVIEPAGRGEVGVDPATSAVSVVVPPRDGEDEALNWIDGISVEIPRVTVLETTWV